MSIKFIFGSYIKFPSKFSVQLNGLASSKTKLDLIGPFIVCSKRSWRRTSQTNYHYKNSFFISDLYQNISLFLQGLIILLKSRTHVLSLLLITFKT